MKMTVEYAKRQWCPLTMATDELCECVGPRCMAWRWADPVNVYDLDGKKENPDRRGYCGMAGGVQY